MDQQDVQWWGGNEEDERHQRKVETDITQTLFRGATGTRANTESDKLAGCDRVVLCHDALSSTMVEYKYIINPISPDHVRTMRFSYSTLCDQMPVSLETLGGDVLLEVVAWLSRFDLLNFVMTVRSPAARRRVSVLTAWGVLLTICHCL